MDDLATNLLRYFVPTDGELKLAQLRTLSQFLEDHNAKDDDVMTLYAVVNRLVDEQLLMPLGPTPHLHTYYATVPSFNEESADLGRYECVVHGAAEVYRRFNRSVVPVVVWNSDGSQGIGTGFLFGPSRNLLVTARHVVEDKVTVEVSPGEGVEIAKIIYHADPNVDLAILQVDGFDHSRPGLRVRSGREVRVLEEVVCMGYPPLAGFDAILIAESAKVAAMKTTAGTVGGLAKSYLDGQSAMLINARVKGGNSGGPVLDREGFCIGVTVAAPVAPDDAARIDELGYGIAIPIDLALEMLTQL